jgi:pimeloyl-ACP methyl ester carboxylesterase
LFDERKCAHRFSYQLKNAFEQAGLSLERFDYHGTGEAPGEFEHVSLQSLRDDISRQVGSDPVCLVGLRFGATLAFDYCTRNSGSVNCLVLLAPVIDGAEYVDYLRRKQHIKNVMTGGQPTVQCPKQDYENIEGFKTSVRFVEQIENCDLRESAGRYAAKNCVYIVQISNGSKVCPELARFAQLLETSARQVMVETVRAPIFWERIPVTDYSELTRKVVGWCSG